MKTRQASSQEAVAVESKVWQAIVKAECFIEDAIQVSEPVDSILLVPTQENPLSSQIPISQLTFSEEICVTAIEPQI